MAPTVASGAGGTITPVRAIFFEEDDARAVVARLRADGFEAHLERERLAGEDDDEDHPWAVLSDAPAFMLEVLVDTHDGWLDEDAPDEAPRQVDGEAEQTTPLPPLDLPTAPRRVKRPDLG
jgi:hypothetical protein